MATNDYIFEEEWNIEGYTPKQVYEVLANASILPQWWTGVYLMARPLRDYEEPIVGAKVHARARGFLPYILDFTLEATRLEHGELIEVRASGDFEGIWRATLIREGRGTRVLLDWRVSVKMPLIRYLSWLLKPLFRWNHCWTTPRGERGMMDYLARQYDRYPVLSAELSPELVSVW